MQYIRVDGFLEVRCAKSLTLTKRQYKLTNEKRHQTAVGTVGNAAGQTKPNIYMVDLNGERGNGVHDDD